MENSAIYNFEDIQISFKKMNDENFNNKTNSNNFNISPIIKKNLGRITKINFEKNQKLQKKNKTRQIVKDNSISFENSLSLTQCLEKDKLKDKKLFIYNFNIKNLNIYNSSNIYIQSENHKNEKIGSYTNYKKRYEKKDNFISSLKHKTNLDMKNFARKKYSHATNDINLYKKKKNLDIFKGSYSQENLYESNINLTTRLTSNKIKYYLDNIKEYISKNVYNKNDNKSIILKKLKKGTFNNSPSENKKLNKPNNFIKILNSSMKNRKYRTKVININISKNNDKNLNKTNILLKTTSNNDDSFPSNKKKFDIEKNIKINRTKTNSISIIKEKSKMTEYLNNFKKLNKKKSNKMSKKKGIIIKNNTTHLFFNNENINNKSIQKYSFKTDVSLNVNNNLSTGNYSTGKKYRKDNYLKTSLNISNNVIWIRLTNDGINMCPVYYANIPDIFQTKDIEKKIKEICNKKKYEYNIKYNGNKVTINCIKNSDLIKFEIKNENNYNKVIISCKKGCEKKLLNFIQNIRFDY